MSEETTNEQSEQELDSQADKRAILIIFAAAILMAVHFVSGFTFDL